MGCLWDGPWPARYLDSLRCRGFSPVTVRNATLSLRCFDEFIGAQGVSRPDRIDDARLCQYRQHLITGRRNAPGTVGMRLRAVRRFLVFLADNGVVSPALAKGIGLPPLIPGLPRLVLSRKQVRAILAVPDLRTARGIRDSAVLEIF